VTASLVARRYAGALFDVARRDGTLERAGRDLADFTALVAQHDELGRVFETPAVPPAKKRDIVEALLAAGGGVQDDVRRLLLLLAERDRLMLLPEINTAFADRAMDARRVLPAEVVTAVPLGDASRARLAGALAAATGCEVTLTETVDPGIVGGVVTRVGSLVFDGSVTRQIERMKARLLQEA
jgi:F-type H+-transporting ATPase subunit delta